MELINELRLLGRFLPNRFPRLKIEKGSGDQCPIAALRLNPVHLRDYEPMKTFK